MSLSPIVTFTNSLCLYRGNFPCFTKLSLAARTFAYGHFSESLSDLYSLSFVADDKVQPTDITPPRPLQVRQSDLQSTIGTKEYPINTLNHTTGSTEKPLRVLVFGSSRAIHV